MASVEDLKKKGNEALSLQKYQEAAELYTQAIQLDPKNHVLYSNRSAAHVQMKKYEEALADAEETIKLNPTWSKGYSRKGAALAFQQRHEEAVKAYEEALKLDPNNEQLKKDLAAEEAACSKGIRNPFNDPQTWVRLQNDPRTREMMKDKVLLERLIKGFQDPKELRIDDPRMMTLLSVALGVDFEGASEENQFTNQKGNNQQTPPPQSESTSSTAQKKEHQSNANAKSRKEPEPMEVDENLTEEQKQALREKELGNSAYKDKDFERAHLHYEKAIQLDPKNVTFMTNKAAVFFEEGKLEDCIRLCEKAIEIGRENHADYKLIAKALARIGNAYQKQGKHKEAVLHFNKSLSEHRTPEITKKVNEVMKILKEEEKKAYINPEIGAQEKEKGNLAFKEGKFPLALQHYSEALKRNPEDPVIYSNRAACYMKLMEFRSAVSECDECIKLDPKFLKGYLRKGAALVALKEYGRAQIAYEKVLELDPGNTEALDGCRQCVGNISNDPEEVKKRVMNDPEVQEILQDPAMRMILEQMKEDPKAIREHLSNPAIAKKMEKLMEIGVVQMR